MNLIALYGRTGRPDEARRHYEAALRLGDTATDAHYNYGVLLVSARRDDEALKAFGKTLDLIRFTPPRITMSQRCSRAAGASMQLEGVRANRQGLGARVGLLRGDGSVVWRRARTDGSYLSGSDPRVHIGLGATSPFQALIVG